MSRRLILLLSIIATVLSHTWTTTLQAATTMSLPEVYSAALKNTESVATQETLAHEAEEHVSQATGRLFPNISLVASYLRQDAPPATAGSPFTRGDQTNARFALVQPLFRGFGEFAERRSRAALVKSQEAQVTGAKLALYSSVAAAYYNVLSSQKDLEDLKGLSDLTDRRAKELRGRVGIGRSRRGELLATEAQVAALEAQIESAQAALDRARETFNLATGITGNPELTDPVEELPVVVASLESMLLLIEGRPDVIAQRTALEAADESIVVARAGHFPSLDFGANYYLKRTGVLQDSKWDLGLTLTVPIFQGGTIQSQVREAADKKKERELALALTRRQAAKEIRSLYKEVVSYVAQHRALKKSLALAENNYDVQNKDYRFGLSTHLDVLTALNTFQETKRLLDRTRYQALTSNASLRAATGTIE